MAKKIIYPAIAEIFARPWEAFSTLVGWYLPYIYRDRVPSVLYWEQAYWYCCTRKNKRDCRHCNSFETVQTRDPEINGQSCKGSSFTTLFVRGSGRDHLITALKKKYLANITLPTITFGRVHLIGREHWSKLFFGRHAGLLSVLSFIHSIQSSGHAYGIHPQTKSTTQSNAKTCFLSAHWKPALNMLKINGDSNQQYFKIVNLHLSNLNNFNHLKLYIKFSVILRNRNKPQILLNEK